MKMIIVWLTLVMCVVSMSGCSEISKLSGPSAETQRGVVLTSLKENIEKRRDNFFNLIAILKINENDLKYEMHPSVKKEIGGNQYEAWPIHVKGSVIIKVSVPFYLNAKENKLVNMEYTLYYFVDNVGKERTKIEDFTFSSKKYNGPV